MTTPPSARRRELLDAILARPDDDDLRLVYADALAEEGDTEHAELVQEQVALARAASDAPRLSDRRARVEALIARHGRRFAGPIAEHAKRWWFERGLVAKIAIDPSTLAAHADTLLESAPVRAIDFRGADPNDDDDDRTCEAVARLARCRRLSQIVEIEGELGLPGDEGAAFERLLASPYLVRLERLVVETYCKPAVAPAIAAASERLPSLRELTFASSSGSDVGDQGAVALAESPLAARLVRLEIWGGSVGAEGTDALARALRAIRRLSLGPVWYANNRIGAEGARALAEATGLSNLEHLDLAGTEIGDDGLRAIADAPWLRAVTELDLSDNALTDDGIRALAASRYATSLERISLSYDTHGTAWSRRNRLTPRAVRALEALPRLRALKLSDDDGGEASWLPVPLRDDAVEELLP